MLSSFRMVTLVCAFVALTPRAKADQITTFELVNAGFLNSTATVAGTVTIDTTTGMATAMDIVVGSPLNTVFSSSIPNFTLSTQNNVPIPGPRSPYPPEEGVINLGDTQTDTRINLIIPALGSTTPSTFQNYTGSDILAGFFPGAFGPNSNVSQIQISSEPFYFASGQLVPTPEPTTITLLGMGFLAFGGFRLGRRRRRATELTPTV
jgi:PEP-CTERM motif